MDWAAIHRRRLFHLLFGKARGDGSRAGTCSLFRYVISRGSSQSHDSYPYLTQFVDPKELGVDGDQICRSNFVLPNLGPKLDLIRQEIHNGKGFTVIRGLDPRKYSVEVLSMLYLGIQSHLANKLGRQDSKGNMLGKSDTAPGNKNL
jgi:hypothetical protein